MMQISPKGWHFFCREKKDLIEKKERRKEGHSFSGKSKKKKKRKRTICTYEKLAFVFCEVPGVCSQGKKRGVYIMDGNC